MIKTRSTSKLVPLAPFGVKLELAAGSDASSLDRNEIFALLRAHKLMLIRGLDALTPQKLLEFAASDPQNDLVHWSFGPVMEMRPNPAAENYLFSHEAVPYHWDGAFHVEPSALIFNCIQAPDPTMGGETIFCDTESVWNGATASERASWRGMEISYSTEKKAHYGGKITRSLVANHPSKGVPILRYAEPVHSQLNPVYVSGSAEFHAGMRAKIYASAYCYSHRWENNDLLLVDNFSLLHGRNAFSKFSQRHLRRIQLR